MCTCACTFLCFHNFHPAQTVRGIVNSEVTWLSYLMVYLFVDNIKFTFPLKSSRKSDVHLKHSQNPKMSGFYYRILNFLARVWWDSYWLDDQAAVRISLFATRSWQNLVSTHPPLPWTREGSLRWVKAAGVWSWPLTALRMSRAWSPIPPYAFTVWH